MSAGLVIREHPGPLPTVEGCASGIVARDGASLTAQCSVCHRTATGARAVDVIVVGRWKFSPDDGVNGWTEYRRCPDCRAAGRHPA